MSATASGEARIAACAEEALRRGATAAFLVPGEPPAYRVGGRVVRAEEDPLSADDVAAAAVAALGRDRFARLGAGSAAEQEVLRLSDTTSVTVAAARSGGVPTLLLVPARTVPVDVRALGLPDVAVSAMRPGGGLVLLTGPGGCGKTTTAYALLEHVNATRDVHLLVAAYLPEVTLEPKRALVTQRRVGVDAPDMVSALGSGLLHDPDVLYAAEIRDVAALGACLGAADAGRLVLTQLHQPTPAAAVRRIVDLHPPELRPAVRDTLARTLRLVLTQRLLPRADGPGRAAAYGWLDPDDRVRAAIAPGGDLASLDALGPPCQHAWEEHARRLVLEGRVRSE